ncbi:atypical CYS HIS rich thioredoxin 4 [Carex rostrata]
MAEVCLKGGFVSPGARFQSKKGSVYCSLFSPSTVEIKNASHKSGFSEGRLVFPVRRDRPLKPFVVASPVPKGFTIGPKSMRWWEHGLKPNMREIESTQDLVDSLRNTGDKLVVVDFFSPSCPGCKTLHPKICQFAEGNPDVLFLQVNYEKHKSMCYSLHVHVLPFFWFFRGAQGRLCGFSCTTQTIKKFRDALAKHTPERCSLGPTKGLDESALMALAANKELNFSYTKKEEVETEVPTGIPSFAPLSPVSPVTTMEKEEKELVST